MAKASAAEIAAKQVKRAMGAVTEWKDGVNRVTVSPTQKAAERVDAWAEGVQRAKEDGSYVDGCNAVTAEMWKQQTIEKGGNAYAPGIKRAEATIIEFHNQRAMQQQSIDAQLAAIPRGDFETNLQRMVTQARGMKGWKFKKRRR